MMGIDETIARTLDEYVSIAAELANDSGNRRMLSRKIADNKSRVYRDPAPIAALQEFLESAVSRTS
jgi:predicted O-linked N-acetylglucosamine transferase (SPINDLY family)